MAQFKVGQLDWIGLIGSSWGKLKKLKSVKAIQRKWQETDQKIGKKETISWCLALAARCAARSGHINPISTLVCS